MSDVPLTRVHGFCTACGDAAIQLGLRGEGGWFHCGRPCPARNVQSAPITAAFRANSDA